MIDPNAAVEFGPQSLLKRPEVATQLAAVTAGWSYVEALMAALLGLVTGAKADAARAIIQSFNTGHARNEALRSVAEASLSVEEFATLKPVLSEFRQIAQRRNELVHSLWGLSEAYPDAAIQSHWVGVAAPFLDVIIGAREGSLPDGLTLRKDLKVIRPRDIAPLVDEISAFAAKLSPLLVIIGGRGIASVPGLEGSAPTRS